MTDEIKIAFNPFKKWPRNLCCFCGSGRKFKKCCDAKLDTIVPLESYPLLKRDFSRSLDQVQSLADSGLNFKLTKPLL